MNLNMKWTALAIAVSMATASAAQAQVNWDVDIDVDADVLLTEDDADVNFVLDINGDIDLADSLTNTTVNDTTNTTTNTNTNTNTTTNTTTTDTNVDTDLVFSDSTTNTRTNNSTTDFNMDVDFIDSTTNTRTNTMTNTLTNTATNTSDTSFTSDVTSTADFSLSQTLVTNEEYENIQRNEDIRSERNEHGVNVQLDKELSLVSDITFSGDVTLSGDIEVDSAAIAVVDNRQSITSNLATNDMLSNSASMADEVGAGASGNLLFNVAAGDNNAQDNAASLSAADASFAFGLADAEIFVNQYGAGNRTINEGVTNAASIGGNAFGGASGNIGVNIASGNNNEQKNAMAASVATSAYAQSSVSSNQVSTGNWVTNAGHIEQRTDTIRVGLTGTVTGSLEGSYEGRGNAYQQSNFYADIWTGDSHPAGSADGHADFDGASQGAVDNPYRGSDANGPIGGLAFDTDEEGSWEMSEVDLDASLTGTVTTTQWIIRDATNTASLSGSAFSGASGNIGVNLASGTGNLQANSLAMAVAQPTANGGDGE